MSPGTVYLVGAGPGDPELLTLKARRVLGEADAVVYDHLVAPEMLDLAPPGCERVFAGKKGGQFCRPQNEIDETLVRLALEGKTVVRLKGGDPFVFGRGGEEAAALAAAGIAFEIVPGVTSALAAAAYAGIPLTHRLHSSSVVLLTGHEDPSKPGAAVRWEDYARLKATLCIYMGVKNLATIAGRLEAPRALSVLEESWRTCGGAAKWSPSRIATATARRSIRIAAKRRMAGPSPALPSRRPRH